MQLANVLGLAQRYGVKKQSVVMWSRRYPTFPAAIDTPHVAGIRLFDLEAVDAWHTLHVATRKNAGPGSAT